MADLLQNLNPEQLQAVTLPAQNSLILAGAGSGKTRVLTTRIAWLISTGQISPGQVLAVTFTNKAAKEMLLRLGAQLPVNTRSMWVGTFHGLCNRFLRMHWRDAHLPQSFQILDSQDQLSAIKRLMKQFSVDEERYPPKQLMWFINGSKEDGLRSASVRATDDLTRRFAELYALYEAQCEREGVVDFAELLLRTYELLRDNASLRMHYRTRFKHILVDEFQDTNNLQYSWLRTLAGVPGEPVHSAVLAVGDDDQSIYAFRGANVGNMAAFERDFAVQNVVKLEQNYRSHGNILDAANYLIANNTKRLGKNLRTDQGPGEKIRVFESASDYQEAQWILEEVQQLHREGTARCELAVLYRSNAQSRVIEQALFNAGIPYRVFGGLRFFERAEIKHALAYLRLMENPNDDTSFMRVVNFPTRGIGARTIEQLQDVARANNQSLMASVGAATGRGGEALRGFAALIAALLGQTQGMTLPEVIEHVIESVGLIAHYEKDKEGKDRIENLQELQNAAASFVTQEGFGPGAPASFATAAADADDSIKTIVEKPIVEATSAQIIDINQGLAANDASLPFTALQPQVAPGIIDADTGETISPLAAFLSHASLEAGDNQAQAGADAVQLMTIHSAKGLEFDAVFLTGLEEGLFPHENALNEQDGVEEERRLMYVAITRARKRLYITFSQTRMLHGQTRYNIRSRFLAELPEENLKWITPKTPGFANGVGMGFGFQRNQLASWDMPKSGQSISSNAPQLRQAAGSDNGFRSGQSVFHNKFGEGVIVTLEGSGTEARAQVNFGRHGMKWLALAIAKLTVV